MCRPRWDLSCRSGPRRRCSWSGSRPALLSLRRVVNFRYYREMNQELLSQIPGQMDKARAAVKTANEKNISADTSITSRKKGFEFLNDLFVKRHRKILWKSALRIAYVCTDSSAAALCCSW